jgi:enolase-phosphatase E1
VSDFLEQNWSNPEVRADVTRLRAEHVAESSEAFTSPPSPPSPDDAAAAAAYVHWLMDRDRKSTALKSIQGKIWEEGYRAGNLRGEVYPDVPPALGRWRRQGIDIAIFSSGSVQAQRSLFTNTVAGDLSPYIRAYFDTTTGPKSAPQSYERIAAALERSPSEVHFVSDIVGELDAALTAGMRTALCVRTPGSIPRAGAHPIIHALDQLSG